MPPDRMARREGSCVGVASADGRWPLCSACWPLLAGGDPRESSPANGDQRTPATNSGGGIVMSTYPDAATCPSSIQSPGNLWTWGSMEAMRFFPSMLRQQADVLLDSVSASDEQRLKVYLLHSTLTNWLDSINHEGVQQIAPSDLERLKGQINEIIPESIQPVSLIGYRCLIVGLIPEWTDT